MTNKEPYQPAQDTEFWCNKCDYNKVNSTDKESGSFFIQFGHAYQQRTKQFDGDYHGVMYALCKECL